MPEPCRPALLYSMYSRLWVEGLSLPSRYSTPSNLHCRAVSPPPASLLTP